MSVVFGGCVSVTSALAANVVPEPSATWQLQHQGLPIVTKYVLEFAAPSKGGTSVPPRWFSEKGTMVSGSSNRGGPPPFPSPEGRSGSGQGFALDIDLGR
jgi:hypothetical protein